RSARHLISRFGHLTKRSACLQMQSAALMSKRAKAGSARSARAVVDSLRTTCPSELLDDGGFGVARPLRAKVVRFGNADDPEGFVFTRKNGTPIGSFGKRWHSACRAAGIPD